MTPEEKAEQAWLRYYDALEPTKDGTRSPFLAGYKAALRESEALIGLAKEVMGWCSHSQRCALTVTDYEQGIECTCGLRDALDALTKRAEERKMKDGPVCIACGLLGSDPIHFDAHGNGAKGDHRFRPAPSHTIAQRIFRDEFEAYREMATATENRLKAIIEEQQAAIRESEALIGLADQMAGKRLRRNVLNAEHQTFKKLNDWIAVPREDFVALIVAIDAYLEARR